MMAPVHMLLVEDNPADADLALETLETRRLYIKTTVVTDGAEAIEFLHRRGKYAQSTRPDLILLDLNLPKMGGRQVLAAVKADADLKSIPVVILTSSSAESDVVESYHLGANCYVTKPMDLRAFQAIVQAVEGFWFTVVKLPSRG
jgi:chemotaxis family two-component system response regulator Rcp1